MITSYNIEEHRRALTGHCYRMLGSAAEADDAVQDASLTALLTQDAVLSMPPYTLWLRGPDAIATWLRGRGALCRGSRLILTTACGSPAFGQYRQGGAQPWALIVLDLAGDRVTAMTSFLDTGAVFPRFDLPAALA